MPRDHPSPLQPCCLRLQCGCPRYTLAIGGFKAPHSGLHRARTSAGASWEWAGAAATAALRNSGRCRRSLAGNQGATADLTAYGAVDPSPPASQVKPIRLDAVEPRPHSSPDPMGCCTSRLQAMARFPTGRLFSLPRAGPQARSWSSTARAAGWPGLPVACGPPGLCRLPHVGSFARAALLRPF